MPAKLVSRTTRIAAPEDKATLSYEDWKSILAQHHAKSMSPAVEKIGKLETQKKFLINLFRPFA